jgi:hypothetical protein
MQVSNTHFVHRLRAAQARRKTSPKPDTHQPRSQGCLFTC